LVYWREREEKKLQKLIRYVWFEGKKERGRKITETNE
jgi:hypothetical protein